MKGRVIVIQQDPQIPGVGSKDSVPYAAAYIVDGRIEDILLDQREADPNRCPTPGEIGIVQVDRVLGNNAGAFAKTQGGGSGFLRGGTFRTGELLIAQVEGFTEAGKAPPLSNRPLLKQRHVILTPGKLGVNISRSIKGDRREVLQQLIQPIEGRLSEEASDCGVILRSEAWRVTPEQIEAELELAISEWRSIKARLSDPRTPKPTWLTATGSETTIVADWGTPADKTPIVIAGPNAADAVSTGNHEPALADQHGLYRYHESPDAFADFGVWDEIERLKSPRADLPSGGWMAVEATRALVTVDVNTGDGFSSGDAMTANIEAARELPRQLRLRGLGGQVIVDFAPLKKMHRKKIEEELKRAFRKDPIETTLAGWTPLGNFELTRKRERRPLSELLR